MISIDQIKHTIDAILPDLKTVRHHLHAHPEIALCETETQAFLKEKLASLNVTLLPPALETDVIAMHGRAGDGPNIVLRADMDALPIREPEGLAYASTREGLMHACGHDGHMTMLLGAAMVIDHFLAELSGSVRYVFQPGEEVVAAGKELIATGVLDEPKPDRVLAMHNWPGLPAGTFSSRPGPMMAAADFFKLTIKGKGGHGSKPEECVDPIYVATRVLNELYQIPSRQFSALDALVISPCMVQGGQSANVIPDTVYIEGTVRYLSKEVGERVPEVFESVVRGECQIAGADYDLDYSRPYMPTINNTHAVEASKQLVETIFGQNQWLNLEVPVMGSEDFSFFLDRYPGAMVYIGNGEQSPSLHNQCFDFNDDIIAAGVLFFVSSVLYHNQLP